MVDVAGYAAGGTEAQLLTLLAVFAIAGAVSVFTTKVIRLPYTVGLVLAGLVVSFLQFSLSTPLTHEFILLVILPTLIFQSAMNIDTEKLRDNIGPILVLAVIGLVLSVVVVGVIGAPLFGFSLVVAFLFGAIVTPTDPVSVVALFDELGAPERLSVLIEGESILNDGVSIVLYTVLLSVVLEAQGKGVPASSVVTPALVVRDIGFGIVVSILGGALIGLVAGYLVYQLLVYVDDPMTGIVFTVVLAYGAYLFADSLEVSGVIAALGAGLVVGSRGIDDISARTQLTLGTVWASGAFVANAVIFVAIGLETPLDLLTRYTGEILAAVVLVFVARAVVVYPLVGLMNGRLPDPISRPYQHVMVWSGIHASVPIALVLGLPESLPAGLRERLAALVFGIAAVTLVLNGLTMNGLLDRLDIVGTSTAERRYEQLTGRLHGVDAALGGAEALYDRDEIPKEFYERITTRYTTEKRRLNGDITTLLDEHPHLRKKEALTAESEIVRREILGIKSSMERGLVSTDVGDQLLEETERRLERIVEEQHVFDRGTEARGGTERTEQQASSAEFDGDENDSRKAKDE